MLGGGRMPGFTVFVVRSSWLYRALVSLLCAVVLAACSDGSDSRQKIDGEKYSALIERTQYGTAHITADDWGSLGFGQGYATAQDRFCVMADQFLKVRSQRARYFGSGEDDKHINSDFAYLALGFLGEAELILEQWGDEARDMAHGYVAGVNEYIEDTGVDNLPGECSGQDWVQKVDVETLVAYSQDLVTIAGSRNFLNEIANATPPGSTQNAPLTAPSATFSVSGAFGSNAVALGSERTSNGRGLLLANPHWPWEGERRLHEVHLTIPGDIDFAGVILPGVPGGLIGFSDFVAWTHTTSVSNQFVIYTLDLIEGKPTHYIFGEDEREMEAQSHTIEVLQPDGSIVEQSRTLYRSHYGPMLDFAAFGLPWSNSTAVSIFDVNANHVVPTFSSRARAKSVSELRDVFLSVGGAPQSNTVATDRDGEVFYADTTVVPMLSDAAETEFRSIVESDEFSFTQLAFNNGFVLLDGSNPKFSIVVDDRATIPGAVPFENAPQLTGRRDFVSNSNDSYWLSNPNQPLTGYSIRYGDVETPRSLRTRMGLTQLSEWVLFDRGSLKELLLENRSYSAELWRDAFVTYCSQFDEAISSSGEAVDIVAACAILANWDGRVNNESIGAFLNRELMSNANTLGFFGGKSFFTVPFDTLDPVQTPSGLSEAGKEYLLVQLADAVSRLNQARVPIDAPLGGYQYTIDGGQRFALHGGRTHADGAFNIVAYAVNEARWNSTLLETSPRPPLINATTGLSEGGYQITFGSSFIMVVEFTDEGPVADAILTYSQSDDPDSPHVNDQMSLYSSKTWRPLPFTREQIEADPHLTSMRVTN